MNCKLLIVCTICSCVYFFFQAEDGIRDGRVTGVQTCALPISGILRKQTPSAFSTSQVTGNYAFGVSSVLNAAQGGGKFAAVGVFNFSSGSITGGEVDFNLNGALDGSSTNTPWPASPLTFNSGGSYAISSNNGRGTASFSLNVPGASPINMVIYVVSATDVLALSSDLQVNANGNDIFAGEALQQSGDRKSTRLNSSHPSISYAVFCLKEKRGTDARGAG